MSTLYGKYPKRISCGCNGCQAEEMNEEAFTISLNERCPICNRVHQVCVPKPQVSMRVAHDQAA